VPILAGGEWCPLKQLEDFESVMAKIMRVWLIADAFISKG
jgi:hypothetical protein